MTITDLRKSPWPHFGGKAHAAPLIWAALGDVAHYVEPFCGSCAVLLRRPHPANRPYYSETVNDASGLLVNALRALAYSPDATADAASWQVSEADVMARHLAVLAWSRAGNLERLMADPQYHDATIGGWWLHGVCSWIGGGYAAGEGPWVVGADGRITRQPKAESVWRQRPHLANNGQGVNRPQLREPGVARQLPHLANNGRGVNHAGTREPGVARQLPHLANDGRGVNHAGTREPGVVHKLPHLANNGQGVNRPQLRESGVARQLPHLGDNGQGVNHAGTREPGVARQRPHLTNNGQCVNRPQLREPGVAFSAVSRQLSAGDDGDDDALIIPDDLMFHERVMPELRRWFAYLSARLRHVRIVNGDWTRVCTTGAMFTLPVRQGDGVCGVFLDPPYTRESGRAMGLYDVDDGTVADAVRMWCLKNGDDTRLRIVLAGFDTEHTALEAHGWRVVEWFEAGYLRGGMGSQNANGHQQHRERLWLSPNCLGVDTLPMDALWGDDDA